MVAQSELRTYCEKPHNRFSICRFAGWRVRVNFLSLPSTFATLPLAQLALSSCEAQIKDIHRNLIEIPTQTHTHFAMLAIEVLPIPLTTMLGPRSSPPGSPSSQMSAPMDESDSDDDATQNRTDDDMNPYPVEGLFKSHEEKARIMSMREIEREQLLAERREENERIRQNRMLRQLKVNQEKDSKKRKASAADLEDASRKTSRTRTKAGEISDKMDTLRRAREERSSRKEQRERENDRRRQRSPSYRRSRSVDDRDSDVDWRRDSRQKSRSPEPRELPPAELRDVERIRVGRSRFAEVCFYPGFEKAITGCYVRINIGPDPTTRQEVYRMAVIKGELIPDSRFDQDG